jgi:hypothetical protein
MTESRNILKKRLAKLEKHFIAIREYGTLVETMTKIKTSMTLKYS